MSLYIEDMLEKIEAHKGRCWRDEYPELEGLRGMCLIHKLQSIVDELEPKS